MLLTIESDQPEISHLLHKHPARVHSKTSTFGEVHVFYSRPTKVHLLLEIDPLRLTARGGRSGFALQPYVNDRAYVASSFLSVALNQMFRTAIAGRCRKRPELVDKVFRLEVHLPVLPCRGGEGVLRDLFEPLGYRLDCTRLPLDTNFPQWGDSSYYSVTLQTESQLNKVLRHLYILMPVLDNDKHYWVGQDEVEKLLERSEDWLAEHPRREMIVNRYLKFRRELVNPALEALRDDEMTEADQEQDRPEEIVEKKLGLHEQRLDVVAGLLRSSGAEKVGDLGCGEGRLLRRLLNETAIPRLVGMDVCPQALERSESWLGRLHPKQAQRVKLLQGSLLYDDPRLHDLEAAALVEVIEHVEPDRLPRVAHNLFGRIRPSLLLITTPNQEYNTFWESLPAGRFRHSDHRFEWTRQEFQEWVDSVKGDYRVRYESLGEEHPDLGPPSQMAVLTR